MSNFFIYSILPTVSMVVAVCWFFYLMQKKIKNNYSVNSNNDIEVQKENAVLQERNLLLQKNLDEKNVILKQLQEQNIDLEKRIISTQNCLTQIEEKKHGLETQIVELKELYNSQKQQNNQLNQKIQNLEKLNGELGFMNNNLENNLQILKTQIDKNQEQISKNSLEQFQNLANQILEEKTKKFSEVNIKNLDSILQPLGKNIEEFKKQIAEVYDKESKERFSLEKMVKSLQENTNKISEQANNLANALQGSSKKQGNWGEMILERILQNSGLTRDVNYFREKSFVNEEGKNLRPDFQILLPDDRLVVTDSKVSLNAYEKFCSTDNKEQQRIFINDHLNSIYSHIDNLHQKKYEELKKSLDFTIMFIPIEPAYLLAIQQDPQLWAYAYQKKILIVSSTNLIVCLKLINDLWQRENQSRNANKIVKSAERLLDKLLIFCESFVKIGKQIDGLNISYNTAFNQISQGKGNVILQVKNLSSNFGLNNSKQIPEILLNNLDDEELSQELIVDEEITKQN